jgi:hypothetical protein
MNGMLHKEWAFAMFVRLTLLAALVVDIFVLLIFAFNEIGLWAILLISGGILIGMVTIPGNARIAGLLCALGLVAVPVSIAILALPIHTFDWSGIKHLDRLEIHVGKGESIVISDPMQLSEFESFVGKGSYRTVSRRGVCYGITLCDGSNRSNRLIRSYCFGSLAGESIERVFVPRRRVEFRRWLERILTDHRQGKVSEPSRL